VKLGTENRGQKIAAIALGVVLLLVIAYEVIPSSSTSASTNLPSATTALTQPPNPAKPGSHHGSRSTSVKKERAPQSLDPTLHLVQLASTEQIKYEGSGRNIFVAQAADVVIPTPVTPGTKGGPNDNTKMFQVPAVAAPPPIPLKFFGFASHPGEPKKIFLSKGDDVFIAGEGEIVDRRYKVVHISPTSVEMQDVVGSGPPQNIPLTQG
jgi:hypothetical protein